MLKLTLSFIAFIFLMQSHGFAGQTVTETNYFASLRSSESNVRSGPGQNYPVKFTYKIKSIPVRVINEYDNWSEIEDYENQTGWINQSLLTKRRTVIVRISKDFTNMHKKSDEASRVLYHLENNVIGEYLGCKEMWCAI